MYFYLYEKTKLFVSLRIDTLFWDISSKRLAFETLQGRRMKKTGFEENKKLSHGVY